MLRPRAVPRQWAAVRPDATDGYSRATCRWGHGMREPEVVADYVIKGAGAAGMAFADSVFTHSDATMVLVDRHDRPGGHWNDVYPFVRLHQPSSFYGVNSTDLGTGSIDRCGPERRLLRAGVRSRGRQPLRRRHAASAAAVGSGAIPPDERGQRRRRDHVAAVGSAATGRRSTVRRRHPLADAGAVDGPAELFDRRRRVVRAAQRVAASRRHVRRVRRDRRRQDRHGRLHLAARQRGGS